MQKFHSSSVAIIGTGRSLPSNFEDNVELCKRLGKRVPQVTPEWIVEKTGITQRCIAAPNETASSLALDSANQALNSAKIDASVIDILVVSTFSGDYIFPPLSAKLHQDLGLNGAQIYDIQANCTGVVTALTAASDRMKNDPELQFALIVGVEMCSRYVDPSDLNTAIYLSDGAGAIVLGRARPGEGIQASSFYTDSSNFESVRMRGGGSSFPIMGRLPDKSIDYMEMNGLATWKQAITNLPRVIKACSAKANIETHQIDFIIFHQANLRMIEYIMKKMRIDSSKTHTNVERIGNTGAASLPIVLSEAIEKRKIAPGSNVILAAVGAGFNFGASMWRWQS